MKFVKMSDFTKNVLLLSGGSFIAKIVSFGAFPIISRLYTPEDFGIFALYMSVAGVLFIVATGKYEVAIMLPAKDEDAANLLVISALLAAVLAIVLWIAGFLFSSHIVSHFSKPSIEFWIQIIPIMVLSNSIIQALNYWNNRKKHYNVMNVSKIVQSIGVSGLTILLGYLGLGYQGMILGALLGQILAVCLLIWVFISYKELMVTWINKKKVVENLIKYKNFPRITMLHSLQDVFQVSIVSFIIGNFYGETILGLYSFANRVLQVPIILISSSVASVFFQEASAIYNSGGSISKLLKKTINKLLLLGLPISIVAFFIVPDLFNFAFGPVWRQAGEYVRILIPFWFCKFLFSAVSQTPIILNMQKPFFLVGFFYNLSTIIIFLISWYWLHDFFTALVTLSVFMTLYFILAIRWLYYICLRRDECNAI